MLKLGNKKFADFRNAAGTIMVCALLAIAITLTGCAPADTPAPEGQGGTIGGQTDTPDNLLDNLLGKEDYKPLEILAANPLEVTYDENSWEELQSSYKTSYFKSVPTYAGLMDKTVEAKINGRIEAAIAEMENGELPPFRGIKRAITEDYVITDQRISLTETGSFNNLLSLSGSRSMTYALWEEIASRLGGYVESSTYISDSCGLVFDLNTGEEISLKDVFREDVDYMTLINDWLSKALAKGNATDEGWDFHSYWDLKLTGPFKGLTVEPDFYLTDYGLCLIFGPEETQFTNLYGFYTPTVVIPYYELGDSVALAYRFMDEETDLYESEESPVYRLISVGTSDGGNAEYYVEDEIAYNMNVQYPEGLHENIMARIDELSAFDPEIDKELRAAMKESGAETAYYDCYIYTSCVGNFVNVEYSIGANCWAPDGYTAYDFYQTDYDCFDAETGELLTFDDIFKEGLDYEAILRQAMFDGMRRDYDQWYDPPKSDEEIWNEVERNGQNLKGFSVETTALRLIGTYLDEDGREQRIWSSVQYRDIGCENLTIFGQ